MSKRIIEKVLKQRRHRREKLRKLREKFKLAKTEQEKQQILKKVAKISPSLKTEDFISSIK